jgi:type VI secretion system protein ImpA
MPDRNMPDSLTLPDLADGSPAGPNLELDAAYGELERAAKGKPETQYGNVIEPATPPDWKETAALAEQLLGRTRDLRVMARLAVARLHLEGLTGYSEIVALIRRHLDTMWDHVHPQLDPEDENDPLPRANGLLLLADPTHVLRTMRDMPLARTTRTGPVSWRDVATVGGLVEPDPARGTPTESAIRAAFAGTDPARLAALQAAAATTTENLAAITATFDTHAAPGSGPDFGDLLKLVRDIGKDVARYAALAEAAAQQDQTAADAQETEAAPDQPAPRARAKLSIRAIVALSDREEAIYALELAAEYFRSNEPSSPLPLLIDRAKRLAPLSFLEILNDLAPDGLPQAQTVVGRPEG